MNLHLSPRKQFLKQLYCIRLPGTPNLFGGTNSESFTRSQKSRKQTKTHESGHTQAAPEGSRRDTGVRQTSLHEQAEPPLSCSLSISCFKNTNLQARAAGGRREGRECSLGARGLEAGGLRSASQPRRSRACASLIWGF